MSQLNRAKLKQLAETRLADAAILLRNRRFSAAYYLAGYSIECGLKACIARQTRRYDFPDKDRTLKSYQHKFSELVKLAGLNPQVESERDPLGFGAYWNVVEQWSEQRRYDVIAANDAKDMLRAISDPNHGVLRWLRRNW